MPGSSDLATPEAAELGGLYGVAGHWDFEQLGAGHYSSGEGGRQAKDLTAPFENFLVQRFQVFGRRRDELTGVR